MSAADNGTEYVFIGADLTPRYQIVFTLADAAAFRSLHKATHSGPISHEAALMKSARRYYKAARP